MYINFKSKYKKVIWFIIGFVLACFYIQKVNALTVYTNDGNIEFPDLPSQISQNRFTIFIYNNSTYLASFPDNIEHAFWFSTSNPTGYDQVRGSLSSCTATAPNCSPSGTFDLYSLSDNSWVFSRTIAQNISTSTDNIIATSINIYSFTDTTFQNQFILLESNFGLIPDNPDYLNGYQKITLTTSDKYYMLSGLSSGSVFIPIEDFNSSGGRLSYYDNDLTSQLYTSYIQDYTITRDGLYARQDFNLNNYYGADWVMFSKYIYLEGEDNITYDIWVPEDITYSDVTITPNSSGGNNFDFQYKDSNGDIQSGFANSIDLTPPQPLLSDVFNNFTTNYYGLSSIVLAPISFLESVNSATCTPLSIPSPIGSTSFSLPCMTPLYQTWFGDFFTLYQTIVTGFIAYYVGLGYFNLIKGLKDPSDDRIEVIHL